MTPAVQEPVAITAKDLGHFQPWSSHLLATVPVGIQNLANRQGVERAGGGLEAAFGDVQIAGGSLEVCVAKQELYGAQVDAVIQQVSRKRGQQYSWLTSAFVQVWPVLVLTFACLLVSVWSASRHRVIVNPHGYYGIFRPEELVFIGRLGLMSDHIEHIAGVILCSGKRRPISDAVGDSDSIISVFSPHYSRTRSEVSV